MNARALSGPWDVVGLVGGHEHLIDHVDHTVAGVDVGHRHRCSVDHDHITHRERKRVPVDRWGRHAIGESAGRDLPCHDVIQQDV